jgi:hypothetical protein
MADDKLWPWELGTIEIVIASALTADTLLCRNPIAYLLMRRGGR